MEGGRGGEIGQRETEMREFIRRMRQRGERGPLVVTGLLCVSVEKKARGARSSGPPFVSAFRRAHEARSNHGSFIYFLQLPLCMRHDNFNVAFFTSIIRHYVTLLCLVVIITFFLRIPSKNWRADQRVLCVHERSYDNRKR